MKQTVDLQNVEQRVRRAYMQDGLTHLFMGLLLAMIGLSLFDPRFRTLGGLAVLLIFPMEIVRRRITYPRIGYVKFALPKSSVRGMLAFTLASVAVLIFLAFIGDGRFQRYLPIAIGFFSALAFYFGMSMMGVDLTAWAIITLIILGGFVAALLFEDWHLGTALHLWAVSLLLLLLGSVRLVRFMRDNPIATPVDQEWASPEQNDG